MYSSYFQQPTLTMRVALRTAIEPTSLAEEVRAAVWKQDRDIPVAGLSSMDEIIARRVSSDKVVAFSVTLFATVAALARGARVCMACWPTTSAAEPTRSAYALRSAQE